MYYYDKPSPFSEEVEDIVIAAVHDLLPETFKETRDTVNTPAVVMAEANGVINLTAQAAKAVGPTIKYMPEWKAFGWFRGSDRVEWEMEAGKKGTYDVYLEWSVSDQEAGKPFTLEVAGEKLNGKVGKTGSWFTYRMEKIGRIRLSTGSQKVVFRHAAPSEKGSLLDLRKLSFVPVK
jgi:hypothetical protein